MNTTSFIEATRQLCAELDAAHDQLVKDRRHMDDLESELHILRATDENVNYAAKWREALALLDRVMRDCMGATSPDLSRPSAETLIAMRDILLAGSGLLPIAAKEAKP